MLIRSVVLLISFISCQLTFGQDSLALKLKGHGTGFYLSSFKVPYRGSTEEFLQYAKNPVEIGFRHNESTVSKQYTNFNLPLVGIMSALSKDTKYQWLSIQIRTGVGATDFWQGYNGHYATQIHPDTALRKYQAITIEGAYYEFNLSNTYHFSFKNQSLYTGLKSSIGYVDIDEFKYYDLTYLVYSSGQSNEQKDEIDSESSRTSYSAKNETLINFQIPLGVEFLLFNRIALYAEYNYSISLEIPESGKPVYSMGNNRFLGGVRLLLINKH
jgi:hypothetical protein